MDNDFDPVAASGESTYRAPRPLELNEILINGDADVEEVSPGKFERKGGFFRKRILIGKARDQKPEELKLGESTSVVFLKIRRKLVQRSSGGEIMFSSNEHTSASDIVDLYDSNGLVRSSNAKAIREANPGLRTVQIIYALLVNDPKDESKDEPELVRITIKGASLGSEAKDENTTDFYKYLSSYSTKEHVWEYVTQMRAVLEKGQKSYFCIDFNRGAKLDQSMLDVALAKMKEVHLKCVEIDQARSEKRSTDTARPTPAAEQPEVDTRSPADNAFDAGLDAAADAMQPNPDKAGAGKF